MCLRLWRRQSEADVLKYTAAITLRSGLRLFLELVEIDLSISHADGMQVFIFELERLKLLG